MGDAPQAYHYAVCVSRPATLEHVLGAARSTTSEFAHLHVAVFGQSFGSHVVLAS
jgi:hypothetical protein